MKIIYFLHLFSLSFFKKVLLISLAFSMASLPGSARAALLPVSDADQLTKEGSQPSPGPDEFREMLLPEGSYVPGRIIVKFKPHAFPAELNSLNSDFGVTEVKPIFSETPSVQEKLQVLKDKRAGFGNKQHSSWYWWAQKAGEEAVDYQKRIAQEKEQLEAQIQAQEALLLRLEHRQKRAPEGSVELPKGPSPLALTMDESTDLLEAIQAYQDHSAVEIAQPDYRYELLWNPNDYYLNPTRRSWGQDFPDLWGLQDDRLEARVAWDINRGEGILVAVLDTGADPNHPDLAPNLWTNPGEIPGNDRDDDGNELTDDTVGWDFSDWDNDPTDEHGHGTHVSGTIAGIGNNGLGIIGVAPNATIMPVKIFPDASTSKILAAIRYATDEGADILSNSWGSAFRNISDPLMEQEIRRSTDAGAMVVFSAGNNNDDVAYYSPQNMEETITVAATTPEGGKADFSRWGRGVHLAAPGVEVLSLRAEGTDMYETAAESHIVGEDYIRADGTSMSCPHVSGALALLMAQHPEWGREDLLYQLMGTADAYLAGGNTSRNMMGAGRLNLLGALTGPRSSKWVLDSFDMEEVSGNGDEWVDPGETFDLQIRIRNLKGPAEPVTGTLTSPYAQMQVQEGERAYTVEEENRVLTHEVPYRIEVTSAAQRGERVLLNLQAQTDQGETFDMSLELEVLSVYAPRESLRGWPVIIHPEGIPGKYGGTIFDPVVDDLDQDGELEVLLAYSHYVSANSGQSVWTSFLDARKPDGAQKQGFPVRLPEGLTARGAPSVGDLDGDGELEIVLPTASSSYPSTRVAVYKKEGTRYVLALEIRPNVLHGYDQLLLIDLDRDNDLEIVGSSADRQTRRRFGAMVQAWHHDGSEVAGWPVYLPLPDHFPFNSGLFKNVLQPAAGDIDGDGYPELLVGPGRAALHALNHDGTPAGGRWPALFHYKRGQIAAQMADLDGDGSVEILQIGSLGRDIAILNEEGEIVNRLQMDQTVFSASMAPGDLDGDGDLEICAAVRYFHETKLYAWHHDGIRVAGWETPKLIPSSFDHTNQNGITIGDVDQDGSPEVLLMMPEGIFAFRSSGQRAGGWPYSIPESNRSYSSATFADLDQDGDLELIYSYYQSEPKLGDSIKLKTDVLDLSSSMKAPTHHWTMHRHDSQRTGRYRYPTPEGLHPDHPWQNPQVAADVDGNGSIANADVDILTRALAQGMGGLLPAPRPGSMPPPWYDVNGDNHLTAVDVGIVLTYTNNRPPVIRRIKVWPHRETLLPRQYFYVGADATDPERKPMSIHWDFGDGSTASGSGWKSHMYRESGNYTVSVRVTDPMGASATKTRVIEVAGSSAGPTIAHIKTWSSSPRANRWTLLYSTVSNPAGGRLHYEWRLDGRMIRRRSFWHRFLNPGSYRIELKVTDRNGRSGTKTSTLFVR